MKLTSVEQFVELVRRLMKERGVNQRELARRAGVSGPYVSKVLTGRQNVTLKTVAKFSLALGVRLGINLRPIEGKCVADDWNRQQCSKCDQADLAWMALSA